MLRPVTVIGSPCSRPASSEALRDDRRAAGGVEVGRDESAARLEVGKERHRRADAIEVLEAQRHAGLLGDRHQVQDGVGRTAGRGDRGDRVLERGRRQNLPRPEAALQQVDDERAGLPRHVVLCRHPSPGPSRCRTATARGTRRRWPSCWP